MCEDFAQKNWLLHHDNAPSHISLFTRECLTKNNMSVVPQPPNSADLAPCDFYPFPRLKIKLKGRHFDTIEVMEAELQAMLNTLTEYDFQDAFKNGRSAGNGAYMRKGNTSRVMVARRPEVSF
jgi:hypothetical protein